MISQIKEKREEGKPEAAAARWYVVETNNHAERQAKFHFERKGIVAYLPMRESLSKRTDAMTATPLFPSYLFAQVGDDAWGDVFGLLGVRSVLGFPNLPKPAPAGMVEAIKRREVVKNLGRDSERIVQLDVQPRMAKATSPYVAGEMLKVNDGPWSGFDAIFKEAVDSRRVMILLHLFGRPTSMTIEASAVSKAS